MGWIWGVFSGKRPFRPLFDKNDEFWPERPKFLIFGYFHRKLSRALRGLTRSILVRFGCSWASRNQEIVAELLIKVVLTYFLEIGAKGPNFQKVSLKTYVLERLKKQGFALFFQLF